MWVLLGFVDLIDQEYSLYFHVLVVVQMNGLSIGTKTL